jgi:hypothetical protein
VPSSPDTEPREAAAQGPAPGRPELAQRAAAGHLTLRDQVRALFARRASTKAPDQ